MCTYTYYLQSQCRWSRVFQVCLCDCNFDFFPHIFYTNWVLSFHAHPDLYKKKIRHGWIMYCEDPARILEIILFHFPAQTELPFWLRSLNFFHEAPWSSKVPCHSRCIRWENSNVHNFLLTIHSLYIFFLNPWDYSRVQNSIENFVFST